MHNSLFGLDKVSYHDEGQAYLCTTYSPTELQVILGILDSAEVPFLLKDRGAGGVSKVIMGFSLMGTDIFVPEELLDKAAELILPVCEANATNDEAEGEEESEE